MVYWYLFIEFVKIGLFAVGGGMATIPFLLDLADNYNWYSVSEFTDMVAVSQSTPGPVGINMATYAGFNTGGILGALTATFGLVLPALIIIMFIAKFMENFSSHPLVKSVFTGIRPVVAALVLWAVWELCSLSLFVNGTLDFMACILCIGFVFLMGRKKLRDIHPLVWIFLGAIVGIIF